MEIISAIITVPASYSSSGQRVVVLAQLEVILMQVPRRDLIVLQAQDRVLEHIVQLESMPTVMVTPSFTAVGCRIFILFRLSSRLLLS